MTGTREHKSMFAGSLQNIVDKRDWLRFELEQLRLNGGEFDIVEITQFVIDDFEAKNLKVQGKIDFIKFHKKYVSALQPNLKQKLLDIFHREQFVNLLDIETEFDNIEEDHKSSQYSDLKNSFLSGVVAVYSFAQSLVQYIYNTKTSNRELKHAVKQITKLQQCLKNDIFNALNANGQRNVKQINGNECKKMKKICVKCDGTNKLFECDNCYVYICDKCYSDEITADLIPSSLLFCGNCQRASIQKVGIKLPLPLTKN